MRLSRFRLANFASLDLAFSLVLRQTRHRWLTRPDTLCPICLFLTFFKFISRLSWFIIYAIFTTVLSVISCILLFSLQVFQHTNYILIFLLTLLYSFSIIMFGFLITPFFDKSRVSLINKAIFILKSFHFLN